MHRTLAISNRENDTALQVGVVGGHDWGRCGGEQAAAQGRDEDGPGWCRDENGQHCHQQHGARSTLVRRGAPRGVQARGPRDVGMSQQCGLQRGLPGSVQRQRPQRGLLRGGSVTGLSTTKESTQIYSSPERRSMLTVVESHSRMVLYYHHLNNPTMGYPHLGPSPYVKY